MLNNLNILLPEIFLTLSIFSILMIGVFIKNSFNLIFNLSSLIILLTIAIILNSHSNTEKIFLESFTRDAFSNFFKILILVSSLFVLNSSKNFILDKDGAPYKIYKADVKEMWNSQTYKDLRLQLLNEEKPSMCQRCWREEASDIKSQLEEAGAEVELK